MRTVRAAAAFSILLIVAACATGPKHAEVAATIPTLKADQGRVYFYRSGTMLGAAIQPTILVNGRAVGDSKPGGFFFVDLPPGPVEVSTTTEVEKRATFVLERGQTRYVRTTVGFGLFVGRIYPELVDTATGEAEIRDASYIGTALR
jgi:hypothetical protein